MSVSNRTLQYIKLIKLIGDGNSVADGHAAGHKEDFPDLDDEDLSFDFNSLLLKITDSLQEDKHPGIKQFRTNVMKYLGGQDIDIHQLFEQINV